MRDLLSAADIERGRQAKCEVCGAKPGTDCVSLCDGKPLLRPIHIGRIELQR